MSTAAYPKISDCQYTQAFYELMRERGESHMMAEMLANQKAPGSMGTDTTWAAGAGTLDQQIPNKAQLEHTVKEAKRHGYTPNPNDYYMPTIARFIGDPLAFMSPHEAHSHTKKVLESQGRGSTNFVKVKAREREQPLEPVKKIAPSLLLGMMKDECKANPDLLHQPKKFKDKKLQLIDKHARAIT